jgi:hypothetical protein
MEITTKYNIGDEVYFINNNKICKDIIKTIDINYIIYADKEPYQKNYYFFKNIYKNTLGVLGHELMCTDNNIFLKKEDLINSL